MLSTSVSRRVFIGLLTVTAWPVTAHLGSKRSPEITLIIILRYASWRRLLAYILKYPVQPKLQPEDTCIVSFLPASLRRFCVTLTATLIPCAGAAFGCSLAACKGQAQAPAPRTITSPKQQFGFNIGDDYHMVNYVQETEYLKKLATESDRMKLVDIGPTAENRHQYMAIITSPENMAKLDHYKEIAGKLARAEGLSDAEAHALSEEGRAVVWIDGGLHAAETVGAQQLVETIYMLNSASDPEILRLLHDDIVLCTFDNPDGMDLVVDWYNREPVPEKRATEGPSGNTPRLWHHYIGHDDNRDFYLNAMPETTNISRILFREWYPQIIYNHHQTGPAGTVIFMPPFRDPFNYDYDPLIPTKIEAVGAAMHERLIEEGKPGSTMRSGANYSTWYNGGLRTITYFHNTIGLLTEIIGSPTPMQLPLIPNRQLASNDLPFPVPPQTWHYRQSIDYELTNNRAVLDYASREKEHLLYDTYLMGKNSIARGSKDSWTVTPKRIDALEAAAAALPPAKSAAPQPGAVPARTDAHPATATSATATLPAPTAASTTAPAQGAAGPPVPGAGTTQSSPGGGGDATPGMATRPPASPAVAAPGSPLPGGNGGGPAGPGNSPVPSTLYNTVLHDPALRDPRGYILPSDQPDFPTATKFVNALIKSGVIVQQATASFTVQGKSYPKGSYVIMTAQAYRPQVLDLFERQDHPNDFPYPGGPPNRPYDATGWTLALQMGVVYDRILDGFAGPFTPIATESSTALAKPMPGAITGAPRPKGWLVSHSYNDAFILTNRLLKAHAQVYWLKQPADADGKQFSAGAIWIPATSESTAILQSAVQQLGISATGVAKAPAGERIELHPQRIALFDQYGGLMPSGWLRWLFEQFEFPFTVIYPQTLDAGNLKSNYDVIVFSDGAISLGTNAAGAANPGGAPVEGRIGRQPTPEQIPAEFRPWLGRVTAEKTIPQLQKFVQDGGTLLAIGSSTASLYSAMNLPVSNAVVEINKGIEQPVPGERFYVPGSLLKAQVDNTLPLAYGMAPTADVFFDRSPAFRLAPDARQRGVETISWYGKGRLLDSGWAWGETYLNDSAAVVRIQQGQGSIVLYGPEITFRGQPHGTFKLLFNALEVGSAQ